MSPPDFSSWNPDAAQGVRVVKRTASVSGGVLLAAALTLLTPFLYVSFLIWLGTFLVWQTHLSIEDFVLNRAPVWQIGLRFGLEAVGFLAWLVLFRPLLARRPRRPASLEVKKLSQPDLFAVVEAVARFTGAPMPVELRVDNSDAVRVELKRGVLGIIGQRHVLTLGLPLVASLSSQQMAGVLGNVLALAPAGLTGRAFFVIRGLTQWLEWVVAGRDLWEEAVRESLSRSKGRKKLWRRILSAFVWMAQRPIWFLMLLVKLAGSGPLRLWVLEADRFEAALIGSAGFEKCLEKRGRIAGAWKLAAKAVQEGEKSQRLPDNFPMLVARHAASTTGPLVKEPRLLPGDAWSPSDAVRVSKVARLDFSPSCPLGGDAITLFKGFQEIARQATQIHYQNDLDIPLQKFRLVAADEAIQQQSRINKTLVPVQRYFNNLVHSERALYGSHGQASGAADAASLQKEVLQAREWMARMGEQMRAVTREWTMAWQRCRDLEMAHAFALAGLPIDSQQYGVSQHSAALYEEELRKQEMVMEYSGESLESYEHKLEARLAAALGLLWQSDAATVPPAVAALRAAMPADVGLYEALAARVASARKLMTFFNAFEALGARFGGSNGTQYNQALTHLLPRITVAAQQLLGGLQNVAMPATAEESAPPRPRSIAAWLLEGAPEAAVAVLCRPVDTQSPESWVTPQVASDMAALVAPLLERFLELYHQAFARLVAIAEQAELYLVDFPGATDEASATNRPVIQFGAAAESVSRMEPAMA